MRKAARSRVGRARVDEARREERVDDEVEVDEPEPDRHRDHQDEDPRYGGVAPVDDDPEPIVEAAQPRDRSRTWMIVPITIETA